MSQGQDAVNYALLAGGMYGPNLYSQFPGRMPQPGYVGTPTDAQGRPITPPPGTTLNTPPPAAAPAPAAPGLNSTQSMYQMLGTPSTINPSGNAAVGMANWGAFMGPQAAIDQASPNFLQPGMQGYQGAGGTSLSGAPAAAAPTGGSSAPGPGSLTNAISLLSNPGKVTTPGANVTPSNISSQPSVLQQFLSSAKKPGDSGTGYDNSGFFDTLNSLRSQ